MWPAERCGARHPRPCSAMIVAMQRGAASPALPRQSAPPRSPRPQLVVQSGQQPDTRHRYQPCAGRRKLAASPGRWSSGWRLPRPACRPAGPGPLGADRQAWRNARSKSAAWLRPQTAAGRRLKGRTDTPAPKYRRERPQSAWSTGPTSASAGACRGRGGEEALSACGPCPAHQQCIRASPEHGRSRSRRRVTSGAR